MADQPKRTVSAKLILKDIHAGMDESAIKRKFGLSDRSYQSVLRKLSEMGLLKEQVLHSNPPKLRQEPDFTKSEIPIRWRCPACGTPQTRAYEECPQCGVIVAKASAMSLPPGHPESQSRHDSTHESAPGLSNRWAVVIVSVLAFLVVGGILLTWSSHKATQPSISATAAGSGSVHTFTTANFERDVKDTSNNMPVLITFYADW